MDRKQTATLLMYLRSSYPNNSEALERPETAETWYTALTDIDFEMAKVAVMRWVMTEKWLPSIADIREGVAQITEPTMDWSEAWSQAMDAVKNYGPYAQKEAMDSLDDVTKEAVKRIGFMEFCLLEHDDVEVMRAHFRDVYNQINARKREKAQLPAALQNKINEMQIGVPKQERLEA